MGTRLPPDGTVGARATAVTTGGQSGATRVGWIAEVSVLIRIERPRDRNDLTEHPKYDEPQPPVLILDRMISARFSQQKDRGWQASSDVAHGRWQRVQRDRCDESDGRIGLD